VSKVGPDVSEALTLEFTKDFSHFRESRVVGIVSPPFRNPYSVAMVQQKVPCLIVDVNDPSEVLCVTSRPFGDLGKRFHVYAIDAESGEGVPDIDCFAIVSVPSLGKGVPVLYQDAELVQNRVGVILRPRREDVGLIPGRDKLQKVEYSRAEPHLAVVHVHASRVMHLCTGITLVLVFLVILFVLVVIAGG